MPYLPFLIINSVLFTATTVMTYDTTKKAKQKFEKRRSRKNKR
ncbi:hypothetical protein [Campylobacter blaseri]|nr:hypothetical protein [Campylobacter blaseri]